MYRVVAGREATTTARLNEITKLFDSGTLVTDVGDVLRLEEVCVAREMLGGATHNRGKIVLTVALLRRSPTLSPMSVARAKTDTKV